MTQLSGRALGVLADMGVQTPAELADLAKSSNHSVHILLHRQPKCGYKTVAEIMEWYSAGRVEPRPEWVWVRLARDADLNWRAHYASVEERVGPDWVRCKVAPE